MKPLPGVFTALCLFGFFAALAWLTGTPPEDAAASQRIRALSAQLSSSTRSPSTPDAVLAKLERELLYGAEPVVEVFSGAELDRLVAVGRDFFHHDGDPAFSYAWDWARAAPAEMCAWLNRRELVPGIFGRDQGERFASFLFERWAEHDLEAALAAAIRLARPADRAQGLASVLQLLWRSDPDRARGIMLKNLDLLSKESPVSLNYDDDKTGPVDLDFLASLPPGKARGNILARVLKSAAESSHSTSQANAVSFWKHAPDDLKHDLVAAGFSLRYAHSVIEPPVVEGTTPVFLGMEDLLRETAETTGDPGTARDLIINHGQAWAARDLDAALDWSQSHLKGRDRLQLSAGLFRSAARSDFEHAVLTWQSLPAGILKARAAGALLAGTPEDRKPEALTLLDTLSTHDRTAAQEEAAHKP